jgi:mRNA interferase RelE/StbE
VAWYRLSFKPIVLNDLAVIESPMAQRLFEKTKWIASNVENLRHEAVAPDMPGLFKYAVGEWRIFYALDRSEQFVHIHAVVHQSALRS